MARVTVEDCIVYVADRFELVVLAAQRARDIASGASLVVDRVNDKDPVIALREFAENLVSFEALRESVLGKFQRYVEFSDNSEDFQGEEKAFNPPSFLAENFVSDEFLAGKDLLNSDAELYS